VLSLLRAIFTPPSSLFSSTFFWLTCAPTHLLTSWAVLLSVNCQWELGKGGIVEERDIFYGSFCFFVVYS
jgi:hypothetical protein